MSTSQTAPLQAQHAESPIPVTAVAELEHGVRWQQANEAQRVVLLRIAQQRDRLATARPSCESSQALSQSLDTVPADAPLVERLAVFAKLHPVATSVVVGLAFLLGPRKLIRYGGIAWPLISKFRR